MSFMKWKKILVVYYSRSGFSKKVAEDSAFKLDADIEELKTETTYKGFFGYQKAVFESFLKRQPKLREFKKDLSNYDLIIVGGPTWAGRIASPVRSFLNDYKSSIKHVAFFNTQGGNIGYKNIIGQMKLLCNLNPMAALSLSDTEINNHAYKNSVVAFISKLERDVSKSNKKSTQRKRSSFPIIHAQTP